MSLNSNVHTRTRVSHSAQITRTRASPLLSPLAWGFHPATAIAPTRRDPPPLRPRSRSKPNASHSKRAFRPPPPPSTPRIARAFLERATAPIDLRASRLEVLPRPIAHASTSRDAHHPLARARSHPRLAFASLIARVAHAPPGKPASASHRGGARARARRLHARVSARGPPHTRYFLTVHDSSQPRARLHARTPRENKPTTEKRPTRRPTDRPIDRRGDRPVDRRWVTARRRTPPRVARARGSRVSTWTAEDARARPDRR